MFAIFRRWAEARRRLRRRWQDDARRLLAAEETEAYYEAQRRATRARLRGDRSELYHWAKVAAETARLSPQVQMDLGTLQQVVADEESRDLRC